MAEPESKEQQLLFQALELYIEEHPRIKWIYATPNGRFRNIQTAVKLKREGQKRGVPDVCVPLKGQQGENGAYVELKVGKNKCTPEQLAYMKALTNEGYVTEVAYSWVDALHFILNYIGVEPKWRHRKENLNVI